MLSFKTRQLFERIKSSDGINYVANAVAPHTETSRATFTIPANRVGIVEVAQLSLIRQVAATTPGRPFLRLTINGRLICQAFLGTGHNSIGSRHDVVVGSEILSMFITTGDVIQISSFDDSSGATPGSLDYYADVRFSLYELAT